MFLTALGGGGGEQSSSPALAGDHSAAGGRSRVGCGAPAAGTAPGVLLPAQGSGTPTPTPPEAQGHRPSTSVGSPGTAALPAPRLRTVDT